MNVTQLRTALELIERQGHGQLEVHCTESYFTGMYPERVAVVRERHPHTGEPGDLHVELCEILKGWDVITQPLQLP
jgi:hypothetical protein